MKTARRRAVRALFSLCLAIFFALSGAASPCFAVNYDYYWSTGSGNEHLWGDSLGGWWEVVYVVDRGGADHPNPQGHYEWEKTNYLNSAGPFKSYAYFSAFNQTVQPKVFNVSLDGGNRVSLESMTIDNTKNVFNPGHDWTFTGDYSFEGKENISANQIAIKGGAPNSRFTTTFSDLYVTTGSLHIYDYNTLLVKDGSRLWASEVVLDSSVLDIRGSSVTTGPITGKNNSSLKISAPGNSTSLDLGIIFTTNVLFYDTHGTSHGNDHRLLADFFDSNITIGDAQSPSWVEFLGQAFSRSIKLNITQGSRLSFAGDNSFDSYFTPFLELSGSGTLRLTGDLQNWGNIAGNAFTGTYDLNGYKLWLDGKRIGSPQGILGGGELTVNLKDALTLGGSEGFFRALASDDLLLSLNAVTSGKLTIADTGESTGGSLSFFSGEGEIILSGGKYNYQDSIFNQHHLTLTNHAELKVATPYNSATYEGGFNNNGRLTIAGPATLHGDLVMLMNSHTTNSLVLKSRFTVDGDSLFINLTTVPGSPFLGQPIKAAFDYRGGKLTTTGKLALNDILFQADLPHPGFYVLAEYGTLTGVFGNAANTFTNVSSLVKVNGLTQTGQPTWLVYDYTRSRILLIAGDSQTILFRTGPPGNTWKNNYGGWESIAITESGITPTPANWVNHHVGITAVFDSAHGTPGPVIIDGGVDAYALVFMDNGWIIKAQDTTSKLVLHTLPLHIGEEAHIVLNSQAPDDPTFANSPRIDAPMASSNPSSPLYKTGAGTLILGRGFYDPASFDTAPARVVIKDGRLVLENNLALASETTSGKSYSPVTIDPGATLRLNFQSGDRALLNPISGTGSLEIASGSEATSSTPQPKFYGTIIVEAGNSTVSNTILRVVDRIDALGSGGDIVLRKDGTFSSELRLNYHNPSAVFPRRITGEGSVRVETTGKVRLASGNSYSGGTTVDDGATLSLEGPGTGQAFSAAGSGSIALAANAGLNLLSGGILNNELGGVATSKLTLDANAYTLKDNNIRTDSTDFAGDVGIAEDGALTLSADVTKGASVTPPFSISGSGGLILDGANVTFSGLDGPAMSSKTGAFLGGTTIMDKTALELGGSNSYQYGQNGQTAITLLGEGSLLELNKSDDTSFTNPLSGTGTVRLFNNRTYTFSGNNMLFAGVIDVNDNTLAINAQSNIGDARLDLDGGTLDFGNNDALILDNAIRLGDNGGKLSNTNSTTSTTLRGYITDADDTTPTMFGNLIKTGAGILTLTNPDSDYKGATTVAQGTLRLEGGGLIGTSGVTVANGATLSGYGQIAGDTTISGGGKLSVDGQFTFDKDLTVTMNPTGGLEFNHGGWLDVGGDLTLNDLDSTNKMLINLDSLGVYVLARYGGTNLDDGPADLSGNYTLNYNSADITDNAQYRNELINYKTQKEILLITLPAGQRVEFWNKDSDGVWNTDDAKNWNSKYDATGLPETWASDSVLGPGHGSRIAVFGTSGVTAGEVWVQGPVAASGLFFLTDGWTVSGGAIRLLDLDPLDIGKSYAVISAQEGNVLINAVLTDGISGAGLHKSGAATVTLNAANTYTGDTLVSAGTLALGNVYAAGSNQTITVESGAFLRLAYDGFATAFPQTVTGAGILEITGNVLLDKENTHSGGTRIYNGRLRMTHNDALGSETLIFNNGLLSLANGLDVSNGVALDGGINLVTVAGGESATLSGVITGGRLNKIGAGTLTLSRANDFTGGLYLDQGRVVAGNDTALGHGTVRMANGAILGFSGNHTLKNDFSLNGANFFEATQTDGGTLDGILYGSGDLTKIGNGTLTLGGVNTYTGLTDVREGTLALSPGGRISGQLALHGGTTFDAGGNDVRLTRLDAHWQANYTGNLNTAGGTMTFFLPADVAPGTQPILNVTGTAEIEGSYVALDLGGRQRTDLLPGHVLALIGTNNGISGTPVNSEVTGHLGITRVWRANLWTDQNNLYAGVTHIGASDESKALPEGYLAGMALINQGADHAAGSGMSEAANASRRSRANADRGYGYATFGTISGGWSRYNTGSHVDMSSLSLMTGIAVGIGGGDTASDLLTLGVFFEYGNGSYDTHNSFANAAAVHGDGDMYYIGGGILGRMEFADTGPGRFYAEASGRVGRIHNEYDNSDLRDPHTGVKADYDSSSTYYGLHFGAGYVWNITKAASLDLYGKYFWTHQEGDKVTLANGDLVRFKAVDSQRLRLGVRFTGAPDERVTPYIGAAYEHEFDGKARASTYGYAIDAPSLRGDTGIGEFGLSLKPSKDLPLSFDLGVQGYMGQREGVTGSLQARLEF